MTFGGWDRHLFKAFEGGLGVECAIADDRSLNGRSGRITGLFSPVSPPQSTFSTLPP